MTEVACWRTARRKFYDAQDSDEQRAAQMLALIAELYAIEREAKDADNGTRLTLRQERSLPVLAHQGVARRRSKKSSCRAAQWPRRSPTPRTSGRR